MLNFPSSILGMNVFLSSHRTEHRFRMVSDHNFFHGGFEGCFGNKTAGLRIDAKVENRRVGLTKNFYMSTFPAEMSTAGLWENYDRRFCLDLKTDALVLFDHAGSRQTVGTHSLFIHKK